MLGKENSSSSWAEQVEQGDEEQYALPPPEVKIDEKKKIKTVTTYKYNAEGKKVREVRTYRLEVKRFSKTVAQRKSWKKFGAAERDAPGPNPANTIVSEAVYMQFLTNKDTKLQDHKDDDDPLAKLKGAKMVACRICKGDHWTTKCPYKDTLAPLQSILGEDGKPAGESGESGAAAAGGATAATSSGKYVPPSRREGASGRGESMSSSSNRGDDATTLRVSNLSEDTNDTDVRELFGTFGSIARVFLSKDKVTGQSRGFAFVNFHRREDAARALVALDGYGYDYLILKVEWAKPTPGK